MKTVTNLFRFTVILVTVLFLHTTSVRANEDLAPINNEQGTVTTGEVEVGIDLREANNNAADLMEAIGRFDRLVNFLFEPVE